MEILKKINKKIGGIEFPHVILTVMVLLVAAA